MRRSSTRKPEKPNPSASSKAVSKESERIDQLFNSYANRSSEMIDPDGIEVLCSDVEVDHTDVRILMLAWKMKAEKQGYFTLMGVYIIETIHIQLKESSFMGANDSSTDLFYEDEWRRGLKALRVDTIPKLKKALPELEKEVGSPPNFVDFYTYAFRYCLTEEKQKTIDIESICLLLDLILGQPFQPQVESFTEYLKTQNDYKVINLDQWMGFFRFCNEISFPDLNNYDPALAWPLILDNYVEWLKEKQG